MYGSEGMERRRSGVYHIEQCEVTMKTRIHSNQQREQVQEFTLREAEDEEGKTEEGDFKSFLAVLADKKCVPAVLLDDGMGCMYVCACPKFSLPS